MPIRILDANTVGRIAAGEVVERPSSVAKELIENSLDAGATSITVEIKGGGIDYLRVTDNGCGIEPGQVRLAFENHATSKLQRPEQLDDIRTLGFRGEALPSIAAVSRVEMVTRARGQESGIKLSCEGGKDMRTVETGCPQGTTIIMRDLFYNVPVRQGFLKKPSYEGGLVSDAVAKLLLGNPGVSMRFISGGTTLYHSFGDGKLRHAVFAVYGRETAEKMVELDASEGGVRIHGLIGVGELAKATRSHQLFFINGRSVRCPLLSRALEAVCKGRVTIGMYPMCVLNLTVPHTGVDVNVHPNKLEVRFRDADMMRMSCERLLARAFEGERVLEPDKLTRRTNGMNRVAEIRELPGVVNDRKAVDKPTEKPEAVEKPAQEGPDRGSPAVGKPVQAAPAVEKAAEPVEKPEQLQMHLSTSRPMTLREDTYLPAGSGTVKVMRPEELVRTPAQDRMQAPGGADDVFIVKPRPAAAVDKTAARLEAVDKPVQSGKPVEKETALPEMRIIGVAFNTYILVETADTLLIIDQHAAHERLQFERYMARAEAGAASQQLLTPILVRLSAKEMAILSENMDMLQEAGYTIEPFGDHDIQVRAVPFVLGKAELRPLFLDMIQSLSRLKAATIDARRSEIMQMACKSAVKAGDRLSDSEIRALIADMMATGAPPTCPHGRPVVKTISRREMEKMFKRIQ